MQLTHIKGNTYYVYGDYACVGVYMTGEKSAVLLDGGMYGAPASELTALLSGEGIRVTGIICTHAHPDHLGVVRHYQALGASVAMPAFEALCMASPENMKAWFPLFTLKEMDRYFRDVTFAADRLIFPDEGAVSLGGAEFEIIRTPGHTPEHICLRTPDNIVYLADALMSEHDCRHARLPYAYSIELDIKTKKLLKALTADGFLLAHGGLCSDIPALVDKNQAVFDRCLTQVEALVAEPMPMSAIVKAVITGFGLTKNASDLYRFRVLERNVRIYVEQLVDSGRLSQTAGNGEYLYSRT